jgi:GTP-sensing pleiotropic transcriptional regulator CodY
MQGIKRRLKSKRNNNRIKAFLLFSLLQNENSRRLAKTTLTSLNLQMKSSLSRLQKERSRHPQINSKPRVLKKRNLLNK